jgi:Tol biopolymer transport system component
MAASDDGTRILLTSRDDYVGTNPSGEEQVWLWDDASGFQQITIVSPCGSGGGNFGIDLAGNGKRFLFASRCRFGGINPDLNADLFLWDEITGIQPLTNEPNAVSATGSLNFDGTKAAFRSSTDLGNGGFGTGTRLFRWREGVGSHQLTTERIANDAPSISDDGRSIAFVAENGQGTGQYPRTRHLLCRARFTISIHDSVTRLGDRS